MTQINYYIIDTSSLIKLNLYYPIDIFPTLWENVKNLIINGVLVSPKEVFKEISRRDDSLTKWSKKHSILFRELDDKQIKIVKEILNQYPSLANSDDENAAADPFLIALAVELNRNPQRTLFEINKRFTPKIVTEEKLKGNKITIPFVCKYYGINWIDLLEWFRVEGWNF